MRVSSSIGCFFAIVARCGSEKSFWQHFQRQFVPFPCKWLDGKHTVFGRVTKGLEVVSDIEAVRVDKEHKPLMDVKMHSIRVKST